MNHAHCQRARFFSKLLVHARAVLAFLPQPSRTLTKLVAGLKPGGWLLIEEPDYISAIADPSMTAEAKAFSKKAWDAMMAQVIAQGYDIEFGRHLYHDVAVNGLGDIQVEGFVAMQLGGTPSARFWKVTFEQVQERVLESGLLTAAECDRYRTLLDSSEYRWLQPMFMSVWGRRIAP